MKARVVFNKMPTADMASEMVENPVFVQDAIHIATKLHNRLLNSSKVLQIGNKIASLVHLNYWKNVSKVKHGLVQSDVYPDDRQNFQSFQKTSDIRVMKALENNVVDSEATVRYLKICDYIITSFISKEPTPIDRVYRPWYAVFFLRCWRKWILRSKKYNLGFNFISSNAYVCVELNAQALQ